MQADRQFKFGVMFGTDFWQKILLYVHLFNGSPNHFKKGEE